MSYCVNCGVELDDSAKRCALCSTEVINPNKKNNEATELSSPFSQEAHIIPKKAMRKFFSMLATVILVVPSVVCFLLNIFFYKGEIWSFHVFTTLLLLWVVFVFPFITKKPRPFLIWAFDTAAVSLYGGIFFALLNISVLTFYKKCYLPLALTISFFTLIFMIWMKKKKPHWMLRILYWVFVSSVFTILLGVFLSFGCGVELAFEICSIIFLCLLSVVLFLAYCYSSKTIRRWLSKRLFV